MWKITIFTILLLLMSIVVETKRVPKKCEEKEKSLALLELAKDSILKAKDLIPECVDTENKTHNNESACGRKEKSAVYISVALKLMNEAQISYPICDFENIVEPDEKKPDEIPLAADCLDVLEHGNKKSGIYTIQVFNSTSSTNQTVNVFCDMDTDGGGWTVIQRRGNFSIQEDFERNWQSYKKGFGNNTKDFWIGNEIIHALTTKGRTTLRIDLGDVNGAQAFAVYKDFNISNDIYGYRLILGEFSGTAGDALRYSNGVIFSTKDRLYDEVTRCSTLPRGGWWFDDCSFLCNLNGLYNPGSNSGINLHWYSWRKTVGLKFSEIKIRR